MRNSYDDNTIMSAIVQFMQQSRCPIVQYYNNTLASHNYTGPDANIVFTLAKGLDSANHKFPQYDSFDQVIEEVVCAAAGHNYQKHVGHVTEPTLLVKLSRYAAFRTSIDATLNMVEQYKASPQHKNDEVKRVVRRGASGNRNQYGDRKDAPPEERHVAKRRGARPVKRLADFDYDDEQVEDEVVAKKQIHHLQFIDSIPEEELMEYQNHRIHKVKPKDVEKVTAKALNVMLAPVVKVPARKTKDDMEEETINLNLGNLGKVRGVDDLRRKVISKAKPEGYSISTSVDTQTVCAIPKGVAEEEFLLMNNLFNMVNTINTDISPETFVATYSLVEIHTEMQRILDAEHDSKISNAVLDNVDQYLTAELNMLLEMYYPTETIILESFLGDFPDLVKWVVENVQEEFHWAILGTDASSWETAQSNPAYIIGHNAINLKIDNKLGIIYREVATCTLAIHSPDITASLVMDHKEKVHCVSAIPMSNMITDIIETYSAVGLYRYTLMINMPMVVDAVMLQVPSQELPIYIHQF